MNYGKKKYVYKENVLCDNHVKSFKKSPNTFFVVVFYLFVLQNLYLTFPGNKHLKIKCMILFINNKGRYKGVKVGVSS